MCGNLRNRDFKRWVGINLEKFWDNQATLGISRFEYILDILEAEEGWKGKTM